MTGRISTPNRRRLLFIGFAGLWLGLAGCGGGGGGGGGGGAGNPPPPPPPPPPSSSEGADLSGPWRIVMTLNGTGTFKTLYSYGVLQVQTAGGSSPASWRGSDTIVFSNRRESHSSSASFTITNNGATGQFTFNFGHYDISCTFTAEFPFATINAFNGTADCPASLLDGTIAAARGVPQGDPMPATVAVDAVDFSTCALGADGLAYCWGKNLSGELGSGDILPRAVPELSIGVAFKKVTLSTGGAHACGLDVNGVAYCWGNREGGRMGDGSDGEPWTFTTLALPVSGGLVFSDIAAGGDHVCAVATDGSAWCWGHNLSGQLGTGDFLERLLPTRVSGNTLFKAITAHQLITCGIATDDSAWCWGDGYSGGLGNGTTAVTNVPVAVSGLLQFAALQLGLWSTCGVTIAGDGYCWGSNVAGELGAGLLSDEELVPVPVAGGFKWKAISPGLLFACGVTTDGGGYCWGGNSFGERGDGTFPAADRNVPGPVTGDLVFESIDADWHSCGVTVDGDVYCWGPGDLGSLGDGTLQDRGVPALVTGS